MFKKNTFLRLQWVTRVESGVFKNERTFPFQNNLFLNLIFVLNDLKELYVFCFVDFLIASSFMTKKPRNSLSKGCLLDESSNDWLKLMKIHFLSFSFTIYLHVWLICFSSSQIQYIIRVLEPSPNWMAKKSRSFFIIQIHRIPKSHLAN